MTYQTKTVHRVWNTPGGQYYRHYADMLNQPHLVIAGTTGSGKSTVLNALIHTALLRAPREAENGVYFILIDPKKVELSKYEKLPHTLLYADNNYDIRQALSVAVNIMEKRFSEMKSEGKTKYPGADIYVIIDEFADLILTDKKAVAPLVQRLAQKGRAAKVHVILCTQCPLRSVIPTEIKVNFDARVGLRTRSAQDSRNILGVTGCETLPDHGQGYYYTPHGLTRYQMPMIPEADIQARIAFWVEQEEAQAAQDRKLRNRWRNKREIRSRRSASCFLA